jgi:heat shock protein HslJ
LVATSVSTEVFYLYKFRSFNISLYVPGIYIASILKHKKMKQLYFICVAILMITVSCKSAKETMKTTTPLFDTKWSLKKIYTDGTEESINTKAFIRLDKEKGSAGGNGSCNGFGSTATVSNNEMSFKNIFSTKMYCEQVQSIENKFLGSLEKVTRYEIKDRSLLLYSDKNLLLEFAATEEIKSTE